MTKYLMLIPACILLSYSYLVGEDKQLPFNEFGKYDKLTFSVEEILEEIKNSEPLPCEQNFKADKQQSGTTDSPISTASVKEMEISAAMNPLDSNNIIVTAVNRSNFPMNCSVYYTTNFGKSWEKSGFKNELRRDSTFIAGGGTPVVTFDADGKAYMTWKNIFFTKYQKGNIWDSMYIGIYWASSEDGGKTWAKGDNECVGNTLKGSTGGAYVIFYDVYDKEWIACDRSESPYRNNLYMSTTRILNNTEESADRIELFTKPAGAATFNEEGVVASEEYGQVNFSMIDVDNSGVVHLVFFGYKDHTCSFYHCNSIDGGARFSSDVKISDFNGYILSQKISVTGIPDDKLYPSPYLAIDKSDTETEGNLYFTWSANGIDSNENCGKNIYFSRSTDAGTSWSSPIIINNYDSGIVRDCFYPSITVNKEGVVIITWYDRYNDPDNLNTEYYIAYSFDGGKTFTAHNPISSEPTNFVALTGGLYGVGQYNQIVSTNGYAIPVWGDGRKNNGDVDIYCALVPITPDLCPVDNITAINPDFYLSEIYPNPASNIINAEFNIKNADNYTLAIYNSAGEEIRQFFSKPFTLGTYSQEISLEGLVSGQYYLVLASDKYQSVRKINVVK